MTRPGQAGNPDPIKTEAEEGLRQLRQYLDLRDQFDQYIETHPRPDEAGNDPALD